MGALQQDTGDPGSVTRVLVAPRSDGDMRSALNAATSLRLGGEMAVVSLDGTADPDSAKGQGFEAIIIVDEDGARERIWL